MQLTASSLAAILAFTSCATAKPLQERQDTLKDWQVTSAGSRTPSGRPGSYPWATITANITDPNQLTLGTSSDGNPVTVPAGSQGINCEAKYYTKETNASPLLRTWPCDPVANGYWTMQVEAGAGGEYTSEDFNLKFTHVADVLYRGSEYTATYEATGHFAVGENLKGTCGGSGVCNWGLADDKKPVLITPKKV